MGSMDFDPHVISPDSHDSFGPHAAIINTSVLHFCWNILTCVFIEG